MQPIRIEPIATKTIDYEYFSLTIAINKGFRVTNFQFSLKNHCLQNLVFKEVAEEAAKELLDEVRKLEGREDIEIEVAWVPEIGTNQWCVTVNNIIPQSWTERAMTIVFPQTVNVRYGEAIQYRGPMDLQEKREHAKEEE